MITTTRLPVGDIRFTTPGPPYWNNEQLKEVLIQFGFTFTGPLDENGIQEATLPDDWNILGEDRSTSLQIIDEKGRVRIEVRSKIPWGNIDWVYFMFLEPGSPGTSDPRTGW